MVALQLDQTAIGGHGDVQVDLRLTVLNVAQIGAHLSGDNAYADCGNWNLMLSLADCQAVYEVPAASPAGTSTPASPTTSGSAPPSLDTTGAPQAIASEAGRPKPSYSEGTTTSVASR